MIRKIYTIRDSKAEAFNNPFVAHSDADATRSLTRLAIDPQSNVCLFPEDFDLYYLGEFDDRTGKFQFTDTPQHVTKAVNVKPT